MNPLLVRILTVVAHIALAALGGWLGSQGWLNQDQSTQAIGAAMTLVGVGLAAGHAHATHQLIDAQAKSISALHAAIQGSTMNTGG